MNASIPIEYDRQFSIHLYWVSHGPLLLRSGKDKKNPNRIDLLFNDVRWMALPVWFDGLRVERGELSAIPIPLTAKIKKEAHLMSAYKLISQGVAHWILAGKNVAVAEDQMNYFEDSVLLPNFDFKAFTAPLWKEAD